MGVGNLQWNNVQAPDFATAMQGLSLAGNSFDRAFGNGQDLANTAQSQLGTNADRQLQLNMMKYQNSDDLKAAVANGDVLSGVDTRFMTPTQLAQPSDRVSTILDQTNKDIQNNTQNYALNRTRTLNTNMDAASPIWEKYHTKMAANDLEGAQGVLTDPTNMDVLSKLTPTQFQDAITGGQGIGNTAQSQHTAAFNQKVTERNDKFGQQANALMLDLQGVGNTADKVQGYINAHPELKDKYDPTVIMAAMNGTLSQLAQTSGSNSATGAPGSGAPGSGGPSEQDVPNTGDDATLGYGRYGLPGDRPSNMTMGQINDFQLGTLRPATIKDNVGYINGKLVGSTAMGRFQLENSNLVRLAPKLFGADWRNKPFNHENQEALAKALYDELPIGADLHNTWAAIKPGTVIKGKGANSDWNSIKTMMQGESGAGNNPVASNIDFSNRVTQALAALKQNQGGDADQGFYADAAPVLNSKESSNQVADRLIKAGGSSFAGEDAGYLAAKIDKVAADNKISPALAGVVLSRTATWERNPVAKLNQAAWMGGDGLKHGYDDDGIKRFAGLAQRRDLIQNVNNKVNTNEQSATYLSGLYQQYQQAAANLRAKQQDAYAHHQTVDLSAEAANVNKYSNLLSDALTNAEKVGVSGGKDHNAPPPPPPVARAHSYGLNAEPATSVTVPLPPARMVHRALASASRR